MGYSHDYGNPHMFRLHRIRSMRHWKAVNMKKTVSALRICSVQIWVCPSSVDLLGFCSKMCVKPPSKKVHGYKTWHEFAFTGAWRACGVLASLVAGTVTFLKPIGLDGWTSITYPGFGLVESIKQNTVKDTTSLGPLLPNCSTHFMNTKNARWWPKSPWIQHEKNWKMNWPWGWGDSALTITKVGALTLTSLGS